MKTTGFLLSFVGSSVQSLGLVLQKKAQNSALLSDQKRVRVKIQKFEEHNDSDSEDDEHDGGSEGSTVDYVKSKLWILGFSLHTCGSILSFVSIGIIGPALFVVISTFSLVSNLFFSAKLLNETSYCRDYTAILIIACGITLCIAAKETAKSQTELTVSSAEYYIMRPASSIVWGCLVGLLGGLTYACRLKRGTVEPQNFSQRLAFIVRSAISATLQVLLSTPTSVLVQDVVAAPPLLWVVAAAMIVNIFIDVHFQNRSLKFNDLLTHGPIAFVVWQIASLITSSAIYEETKGFGKLQWIFSAAGMSCTILGVLTTASRPQPGSQDYHMINYL